MTMCAAAAHTVPPPPSRQVDQVARMKVHDEEMLLPATKTFFEHITMSSFERAEDEEEAMLMRMATCLHLPGAPATLAVSSGAGLHSPVDAIQVHLSVKVGEGFQRLQALWAARARYVSHARHDIW